MATPSADAGAASRTSLSPSRNPAAAAAETTDAHTRTEMAQQLSAADCSVGDDTGAVASSIALSGGPHIVSSASAERISSSETDQHPPPPPPFEPLFAMLTNTTTGTTVHPRIHYIFSDDDASIPTDAAAHPHDGGDEHRSLVVVLEPTPTHDSWAVSCASSLGPEFAITSAALSKQQGEGGTATEPTTPGVGGASGSNGALMLHVEGVSRDPVDLRSSAEAIGGGSLPSSTSGSGAMLGREDLEVLADDFRRRMGILKKVVGEGEKRRAVMAQQHHEGDNEVAESNEIHDPGALRSGSASQSQDTTVPTTST